MKKLILALLVLTLSIFAMASCNNDNQDNCNHASTTKVEATVADCNGPAYTEGVFCNDCQKYISGHVAEGEPFHSTCVTTNGQAATCEKSGLTPSSRCLVCRVWVIEEKVIEKLPHNTVNSDDVAATCTESGSTGGKHCKDCSTVIEEATMINPLGHQFGEWTVTSAPAVGVEGVETRTCTREGCDEFETRSVAALPDTTPDTNPDTTPDTNPDTTPDTNPDTTPDTNPDTTPAE